MVADPAALITILAPKLFVVVLMSVAVVFAVAFFLLPASLVSRDRHHGGQDGPVSASRRLLLATFIRQNVVVVGILLFYVISSVPDLLRVINESVCWQAFSQCSATHDACAAHHVDLFYYSVRLVLTSMIVLMCWSFRGVVMCRNLFVSLGLATFAAAMSCLWFDTWLTELIENLKRDSQLRHHHHHHKLTATMAQILDSYDIDDDVYDRTTACRTHNTTIDNLLATYERFFYPCTFELALLVIHSVVHWYSNSQHLSSTSHQRQAPETLPLLSYRSTDDSSVGGNGDVSVTSPADVNDVSSVGIRGHYSVSLVITSTLVNIVYCLLTFLAVYAHIHYFDNLFCRVHMWYELFYRALLTTVLVAGFFIARGNNGRRGGAATKRQSHAGVEYLVLFTSWVPVTQSLLSIIAYSSGGRVWITLYVRLTTVLGETIAILHVAIQTMFVFYAKNLRCSESMSSSLPTDSELTAARSRRRSQFRAVLLVVALSNLAFWVNGSFVEINMAYGYSYHRMFFYDWVPLISIGVPVAVFYYFNCALLCLDVFLNC